jgi:hypothetical protein
MRSRTQYAPFHVGDDVYDKADPRHVGRCVAIHHSTFTDIEWANGWRTDGLRVTDVQKAGRE